ncbi:DUF4915 domain-containing protein [Streptomyces sp. WZ-12]|uniref:DUF4915 domain-containing protein n=1 Tax=Streptomyces sp. WZ-12 TaxID=3030210 RepID=UPI002380FC27|nr:DUF4915 domain-containing protein [Streptomyces sp. WZ-12]
MTKRAGRDIENAAAPSAAEGDLPSFVPEGQTLLVSCFDAHHTIGGGLFAIGRGTQGAEIVDRVSSSGLVLGDDGLLHRCLWSADGSPAELVTYDTTGVRRYHRLDNVSTPHDLLPVGRNVLVAATMQNEVRCVGPDGEAVWSWHAPGEPDSWHVNSLALYRGQPVVCGFGQYLRRRGWDENGKPASGRVVRLDTGEPVLEGLRAPHNPWYQDGTWLICDSAAGELVEFDDATRRPTRALTLPGWPRGLVVTDRYVFVGLSPHRHAASSVATAAVAVVDRQRWSLAGLLDLSAREVYALALVPDAVAAGVRTGFGTNATRVHEQGQRQLFDQLGVQPRRLWAIGDRLTPHESRARLTLTGPQGTRHAPRDTAYQAAEALASGADTAVVEAEPESLITFACTVRNIGSALLTPAPPYPVRITHRWYDAEGKEVTTQSLRSALTRSVPPGDDERVPMRARVPSAPGRYRLRVTLTQDDGEPFDLQDELSGTDVVVDAVVQEARYVPLRAFGIAPADAAAARTAGPLANDMVRALLHRPTGEPDGLVLGRIEDLGRSAFTTAVAQALDCTDAALDDTVAKLLPEPSQALLTGAEAVALAALRGGEAPGAGRAFATAEDGALAAAFARLGTLAAARDAQDALGQAAGASQAGHGAAVAVLTSDAELLGASVALAASHGSGTAPLVLAAPASDGPALALLRATPQPARSWYDCGTASERDADTSAAAFAAALRQALRTAADAPSGPVLLTLSPEAAVRPWVPLSTLGQQVSEPRVPEAAPVPPPVGGPLGEALHEAVARPYPRSVFVTGGRHATGGDTPPYRAVPFALGRALAEPAARVLCLVDGAAFAEGLPALAVARRELARIVLVVAEAEEAVATATPGARSGGEVPSPVRMAEALGVPARRVSPTALALTLTELADHSGPAVIELLPREVRDA